MILAARKLTHLSYIIFEDQSSLSSFFGFYCTNSLCFAAAADRVYAQPATITGAIGSTVKEQSLLHSAKKLGVDVEVISAGKNAAMCSDFTTLSKEQRQIRQHHVDRQVRLQHITFEACCGLKLLPWCDTVMQHFAQGW